MAAGDLSRSSSCGGRRVGAQINAQNLLNGVPYMADFIARMMPPNFAFIDKLWKPAVESLQVAIWGTIFGVILALPICVFAARNLSPHPAIYHFMRQVLNVMRGINEIILALIFVAAIGLGPFAGVLALAIHGAGMLGKFFAEAIEDIDDGPLEAFQSAGVGPFKTILFGVLPQVMPTWLGTIFYRLETNVRQSTVLGMVGRRRYRLRAGLQHEAVPVPGHRHVHPRDPGDGAGDRPRVIPGPRHIR